MSFGIKKTLKYGNKKIHNVGEQLQVQVGLKKQHREEQDAGMIVVRARHQLRLGARVLTLKHPTSPYSYGKLSIYHNKPARIVSFPPGEKFIRLRFEDGSLLNWMFEDVKVDPEELALLDNEPNHHLAIPLASSAEKRTDVKWLDPKNPPPADDKSPSFRPDASEDGQDIDDIVAPPTTVIAPGGGGDDLAQDVDVVAEALRAGDWVESFDPKTNRKYWWNADTRATTWDLRAMLEGRATADTLPPYFPEKLQMHCPDIFHRIGGTYRRQQGLINELPYWYSFTTGRWLYSTPDGRWALTNSREDFFAETDKAASPTYIVASTAHKGTAPATGIEWIPQSTRGEVLDIAIDAFSADFAHFVFDVFYLTNAPQQAGKAGKLAESVHSGAHNLEKVLRKLCTSYQVKHEDWDQEMPRAVVNYVLQRHLQDKRIEKATWYQTDIIAARIKDQDTMAKEMVKLCEKTGGDVQEWTGPYPLALRYPELTQDEIRFRVEALRAVEGGENRNLVNADDVIERVLVDGERFDSVMTSCCVALGVVDYPAWTELVPKGLVTWVISTFFNTYDPEGKGGEADPISKDVSEKRFTLDEVMMQLCSRWRDKGAESGLWTGEYPEAMRRVVKHKLAPEENPLLNVSTKRRAEDFETPDSHTLRTAAEAMRFKLAAFDQTHGISGVVQPIEHLEPEMRKAKSTQSFERRMEEVLEEYMKLCDISSPYRYLWRGRDPPALLRYRFDKLIETKSKEPQKYDALRDDLLAQVAHGDITVDEGVEELCRVLHCSPPPWIGPYPKALQAQQEASIAPPEDLPPPPVVSAARERAPPQSVELPRSAPQSVELPLPQSRRPSAPPSDTDSSIVPDPSPSPRRVRMQTPTPSVASARSPALSFDSPDRPGFYNKPNAQKPFKILKGPIDTQNPEPPPYIIEGASAPSSAPSSAPGGYELMNRIAFHLNVFHDVMGLRFGKVKTWVEIAMQSPDPKGAFQKTMRDLCKKHNADARMWCGDHPHAVYEYVLAEFFATYDPESSGEVPSLVAAASSNIVNLQGVLAQLCAGYNVPTDYWEGEYPQYFKLKAEASRRRIDRLKEAGYVTDSPRGNGSPDPPRDAFAGSHLAHLIHFL